MTSMKAPTARFISFEDITPEAYLRYAEVWVESGADIIGGCCGITPDHIGVLAEALKSPPPVALPDYA